MRMYVEGVVVVIGKSVSGHNIIFHLRFLGGHLRFSSMRSLVQSIGKKYFKFRLQRQLSSGD